ncbi:hypothetical protein D3C71_1749250 [compost metagenome]
MQHIVVTLGQRQVPSRRFPGFHQLIGIHHEGLAIGRQPRPGTVAHEQGAAQLAFEFLHPRGDRGLGDMEFLGGGCEAAVADDFQEGTGEVDVHGVAGWGSAAL